MIIHTRRYRQSFFDHTSLNQFLFGDFFFNQNELRKHCIESLVIELVLAIKLPKN